MNTLPTCLVLSTDAAWVQRIRGYVAACARVRPMETAAQLAGLLDRLSPTVVLLDLRTGDAPQRLRELRKTWPETQVLAFGTPGTDPLLAAEAAGVYAAEDLEAPRERVASLVCRALDFVAVLHENRLLREKLRGGQQVPSLRRPEDNGLPVARRFPGTLRHFDDVETLVQGLVEDVAGALMVSRVGIFCRTRGGHAFRLRAALRCLDDSREFEFVEEDPLVRWLQLQAHVVCRAHLQHIEDPGARLVLQRALDQFGAEAIVPLQSRQRLLGWLFVGHRATGTPWDDAHLNLLVQMAECVATTIENALLYEEVAIQKTLAETLLQAMPAGIVAVDGEGMVRWFNATAERMLAMTASEVLGRRVEILGSRLADLLHRALRGQNGEQSREWSEGRLHRRLSARALRLQNGTACLGAMALLQDVTGQRELEEREERTRQSAFWSDLAAGISHEIRNPLVAIKAFAQLLPERYTDPEFQNEFKDLVTKEIERLGGIIEQIDGFAHPPPLRFGPVDIRGCVQSAVDAVLPPQGQARVALKTRIADDLPPVWGDARALTEALAHLVRNAVEALAEREGAEIAVWVEAIDRGDGHPEVEISVQDNGPGIAPELRDKVFSPFCTTKARGLGLGLPTVKRTVTDHQGRLELRSTDKGTRVTVILPCTPSPATHETHPHRG